ncbi:MAG TPA: hypothetical protein VGM98_05175 [Schlesneria sp.]|jgi:hypothetical protein
MIHTLEKEHPWMRYPAFYNAYPIRNEVSHSAELSLQPDSPFGNAYCDTYYGRIFDEESHGFNPKYGLSAKLGFYVGSRSLEVVEEFRVPYRRIPVFKVDSLASIKSCVAELVTSNPDYEVLLRGQTKTYLIDRPLQEKLYLYGDEKVREPSFLPSHLRKNFDVYFLKCMWQSQAAILLNDVMFDVGQAVGKSKMDEFGKRVSSFRSSPLFHLFSLGMAQHYGLPSVGLDLTDRLEVASWFATHSLTIAANGEAKTAAIDFKSGLAPTVFVFRCPRDAVFDYKRSKIEGLPPGRPDHQSAWFGHVGWGAASNQLGSYLMCGFRLEPSVLSQLDPNLSHQLFPIRAKDLILDFFLKMKNSRKYEGEAKRALQGIYHVAD